MKEKTTYNPYGVKDKDGFSRLSRITVWFCPLISLALYFFAYQLLVANRAPELFATVVYYLTEAFSTATLFAFLALLILTVAHEERAMTKKLLFREALSLFLISFVLRVFWYILTVFLDNLGFLGGFYLNDVTLSYLFDMSAFNFWMKLIVPSSLGVLSMFFVIFLSLYFAKKVYAKGLRGKTDDRLLKIPIFVYLAVSVVFAVINTVMTIVDIGFALTFPVVFTLLLPYVEIGVLTVIGQYVIGEIVARFDK